MQNQENVKNTQNLDHNSFAHVVQEEIIDQQINTRTVKKTTYHHRHPDKQSQQNSDNNEQNNDNNQQQQNSSPPRHRLQKTSSDGSSQKSQMSKNKGKSKPLTVFNPNQYQDLPTIQEFDDTFQSFKKSFKKLWLLNVRFFGYIFSKIFEFIVLIFTVIAMILKEFASIFLVCIVFINKSCMRKINRKDPFKRIPININYSRLKELDNNVRNTQYGQKPYTLVLDLDETLIYSSTKKRSEDCIECQVKFSSGTQMVYYVILRPYLYEFLNEVSKYYNIIVYTAANKDYADAILDKIDTQGLLKKRFYRDNCIKHPNGYIKDLSIISNDFSKLVMIDNSAFATQLCNDNCLIIKSFRGDVDNDDETLEKFQQILQYMVDKKDHFRDMVVEIKNNYF